MGDNTVKEEGPRGRIIRCAVWVQQRGRNEADAESKPTISAKLCVPVNDRPPVGGGTSSARDGRRGVIYDICLEVDGILRH